MCVNLKHSRNNNKRLIVMSCFFLIEKNLHKCGLLGPLFLHP